jgi:hypothetical protein
VADGAIARIRLGNNNTHVSTVAAPAAHLHRSARQGSSMRTASLCVLLTATLLGGCASSTTAPKDYSEDTFSANSRAQYSAHSDDAAASSWSIENGAMVARGPALQSVLLRNGVIGADGWVEAVSSRADDGGLVLRYVNDSDYYLLAFRDDSAPDPRGALNLAVYHRVNGEYDEMWRTDVEWRRGTAHTIRFQAAGGGLMVFFDGVQRASLTPSPLINDPAPSVAAGGIGLRNYGESVSWVTSFESFRWQLP